MDPSRMSWSWLPEARDLRWTCMWLAGRDGPVLVETSGNSSTLGAAHGTTETAHETAFDYLPSLECLKTGEARTGPQPEVRLFLSVTVPLPSFKPEGSETKANKQLGRRRSKGGEIERSLRHHFLPQAAMLDSLPRGKWRLLRVSFYWIITCM